MSDDRPSFDDLAQERMKAFDTWWSTCGEDEDLAQLQAKIMAECVALGEEGKMLWIGVTHLCRAAHIAGGVEALESIIDTCGLLPGGPGTEN